MNSWLFIFSKKHRDSIRQQRITKVEGKEYTMVLPPGPTVDDSLTILKMYRKAYPDAKLIDKKKSLEEVIIEYPYEHKSS